MIHLPALPHYHPHPPCAWNKNSIGQGKVNGLGQKKNIQISQSKDAFLAATGSLKRLSGTTPCPRSGAEAGRTLCRRGGSQEELPHIRGQGQQPRVPGCDSARTAKVKGGSWEELPQVQGAVDERALEGLEELFHVQDQEGRHTSSKVRSSSCALLEKL